MKKCCLILSALLLFLTLTACGNVEVPYRESELNPDTGISLRAVYPVYDEGCEYVSYVLENNSEETIEFGSYFHIERQVGKRWKRVKASIPIVFTDILYFAMPGTTRYESCYLNPYRSEMGEGHYRIVREIDGAWYTAEFEIGDSPITAQTPHGFVPLEELPEAYSPEQAEADGVVVLREEAITNEEVMSDFFSAWTHYGFRGQLRVMHETEGGWVLTDLILGENTRNGFRITCRIDARREGASEAVSTAYYSFFHVENNRLWLSERRDFDSHDGALPLYGGCKLPPQIAEKLAVPRDPATTAQMIAWSPDGKLCASIGSEGDLWMSTDGWGTVCGGEFSGKPLLDLVWQDANTLLLIADGGEPGLYFYEFIHVDAEDMKSIRTLSYTYSAHSYVTDEEGRILIPE